MSNVDKIDLSEKIYDCDTQVFSSLRVYAISEKNVFTATLVLCLMLVDVGAFAVRDDPFVHLTYNQIFLQVYQQRRAGHAACDPIFRMRSIYQLQGCSNIVSFTVSVFASQNSITWLL